MSKFYFGLLIILLSGNATGQITFEQVMPLPPAPQIIADIAGVRHSSIAFADIDNDNDLDVLVTGENGIQYIAKLYINDGIGNYTLDEGSSFEGVYKSSVAFVDIDNDNDQDVLITGFAGTSLNYYPSTKLYTNDGNGSFEEEVGASFEEVAKGSIAFADIDNDNDQDLLITGINSSDQRVAKLYFNDGNGNYSLEIGTPFVGIGDGFITFSDIDNDNDQDVLITGENNSNQNIAILYVNDGSGVFNEVIGTPFDGVRFSSIAFADIDNDNDQDVIITGENNSDQRTTKLYANDGNGIFTEITETPFDEVSKGSVAFADIDNDNDLDILIIGSVSLSESIAKLYLNDSNGNFSLMSGTPFGGVKEGSIAFADIDSDNNIDMLISGINNLWKTQSYFYVNDGSGNYAFVSGTPFEGVYASSIAFADIDNDNDQDVLISGAINSNQRISRIYTNDGNGVYTPTAESPFIGVYQCSVAFADIDNDNDQDVLITGRDFSGESLLYTNDGVGNFTEVTGTPFSSVSSSAIAFADIDNDNDQDVLITGLDFTGLDITRLYKNDGDGNFTLVVSTPFDNISQGAIAFADIDNDNDQDLLITGLNSSNQIITKLYKNNGVGTFFYVSGTSFEAVVNSSIAFADIDNDNDQDVLITGGNNSGQLISKLYNNDGFGNYTLVTETPFDGVGWSSVAFADVNNDNTQDVLICGYNNSGQTISKLYENDGSGNFTEVIGTPFVGIDYGSIAFSDIDNDNDQDVLITGDITRGYTKLYRNTICNTLGFDVQTACGSYTWIDGITYTSNNNTATYTLINSAGCDSLVVLNLTINTVDVSVTINDPSITANETEALYQWLDCNDNNNIIFDETEQTFTAVANGVYAVEVTKNNCTDTSLCITISTVTISEISIADQVFIYPNPNNGIVNIELGNLTDVKVKVLNEAGQIVYYKENINTTVYQMELNETEGIYIIEISSAQYKKSFKLVKQ